MRNGWISRRANAKRKAEYRKEKGLCLTCGKNKTREGKVNCKVCADKIKIKSFLNKVRRER